MKKCRVCGATTNNVFNICLRAVPICEGCANAVTKQQVVYLANTQKPKQHKQARAIEEMISMMGDSFRGLWRSYQLDENDEPTIGDWTVTFIFNGHYVETPDLADPHACLNWALKKLEKAA
jgi:hypothetical protein